MSDDIKNRWREYAKTHQPTGDMAEYVCGFAASEVALALQPRDAAPELAEAEHWLRAGGFSPPKMSQVIVDELDRQRATVARLEAEKAQLTETLANVAGFDKRGADALADEVDVLVRNHVIDSRSPAADALLDYRDPPSSPRSDRMLALEAEVRRLQTELRHREIDTLIHSQHADSMREERDLWRTRAQSAEAAIPAPAQDRATRVYYDNHFNAEGTIVHLADCGIPRGPHSDVGDVAERAKRFGENVYRITITAERAGKDGTGK